MIKNRSRHSRPIIDKIVLRSHHYRPLRVEVSIGSRSERKCTSRFSRSSMPEISTRSPWAVERLAEECHQFIG